MNVTITDKHFNKTSINISFLKWLKLKIFGSIYVFHARKEGWSGSLPFYIVKCGEHGYFLDYLHGFPGYNEGFNCPFCLEEIVGR